VSLADEFVRDINLPGWPSSRSGATTHSSSATGPPCGATKTAQTHPRSSSASTTWFPPWPCSPGSSQTHWTYPKFRLSAHWRPKLRTHRAKLPGPGRTPVRL